MNNNNNKNKKKLGTPVAIALLTVVSSLFLGAVAVPTITPTFADSHDGNTEKNIDDLIIINKDNKPLSQEGLLQILTEQPTGSNAPFEQQPSSGFSAPSLP
jgi:hypothetical protein